MSVTKKDLTKKVWISKDADYTYNQFKFSVGDLDTLTITQSAVGRKSWVKVKHHTITIENASLLTALDIINRYPDLGRHFEDGILTVYKDMGWHIGGHPYYLKDPVYNRKEMSQNGK